MFLFPRKVRFKMQRINKNGTTCAAAGCSMRRGTNLLSQVKLFHFPKNPVRRAAWAKAVNKENWTPTDSSALCYLHFISGRPSSDPEHPDYIPSIFSFDGMKKRLHCERNGADKVVKPQIMKIAVPPCNRPASSENINGCKNEKFMETKRENKRWISLITRNQNCIPDSSSNESVYESGILKDDSTLLPMEEVNRLPLNTKSNIIHLSASTDNISTLNASVVEQTSENISPARDSTSDFKEGTKINFRDDTLISSAFDCSSLISKEASPQKLKTISMCKEDTADSDDFLMDYSVFDASSLDSREALEQKLQTLIIANKMLQQTVIMYKNKYAMCEKEVKILKRVIEDLQLINSVSNDS